MFPYDWVGIIEYSGFNPKYIYLYGIVWTINSNIFQQWDIVVSKIVWTTMFRVKKFFITYENIWIEQVIWKTKHPIFICSEHFDKNCYRNKESKILRNGAVPSIFKMGCVNNSLQVARHDHSYQIKSNLI